MLRYVVKAVVLFLAYILQYTIGNNIALFGISPSFILVTLLVFTMLTQGYDAIFYALSAGVATDLLWGRVFGLNTLLFLGIALVCYFLNQHIYKKNLLIMCGYAFAFTALYEFLYYILAFAMWGGGSSFAFITLRLVLPKCCYNAVLTLALFPFISWLDALTKDKWGQRV